MDDESSSSAKPVSILPKVVFGLRTDIKGNIHFTAKNEVIYPVSGVIAIHDYVNKKQKFLRLAEKMCPTIISMSPNRKMLAISEWNEMTHKTCVNVYDLPSFKKRRTLSLPSEVPHPVPAKILFTYDSKGVAVLSEEPDAFLTIFFFDKSETIICGRVSNGNQKGLIANYLACNLNDTGLVAIGGDYTFKLMSRQDKSFGTIGTMTGEHKIITSLIWLTAEILVAGTSHCQLQFVEGGDPKVNFDASTVSFIDLEKAKESDETAVVVKHQTSSERNDVNCLTYFENGFCYSIRNCLYVFEKEKSYVRYTKRTLITIPVKLFAAHLFTIWNVSVNGAMDTVIVTAKHSQIYIAKLFEADAMRVIDLEFSLLGEPLHVDGIISMSVCSWKPIIMTASKDQTIRIWNYENGCVELVKKYLTDVTVIALHPTGLFVAVGFSDQLRLMEILLDDLKIIKSFNFPFCKEASFSHEGHMLVCAYDNMVTVVSVFSFNVIRTFKGHHGEILSLIWSIDDRFVVSCGNDGAVYEWELSSGNRTNESIQKGIEYRSVAVTKDSASIYAVTNSGVLREISKSDIIREVKPPHNTAMTCLALARSDLVMFMASENGHLYNIQIPFLDAGGGTCTNFRLFSCMVTSMKFTFDDRILATGGADGTLVIWVLMNNEGRVAAIDEQHGKNVDVVIPRQILLDKNDRLDTLETRLGQQSAEFQYKLRQVEAEHEVKIGELGRSYQLQIDQLSMLNSQLERTHMEEINILTVSIAETKDEHSRTLLDIEGHLNEKMIIEFEKTANMQAKMNHMKEEYEKLLRKSAGCLEDTIATLEHDFQSKQQESQQMIHQLMKEIECKKSEFVLYCQQLNVDNDRRVIEIKMNYEKKLKDENESMQKWRADAGVLNKKLSVVSANCVSLEKEFRVLQNEHTRHENIIRQYEQDLKESRREVQERERNLVDKQTCYDESLLKYQELEKYRDLLLQKTTDLRSEIGPKEHEVQDKKHQIIDMERELEKLESNNVQMQLKVTQLLEKCHGLEVELKTEKRKFTASRGQISKICRDIYNVSRYIQNVPKLKEEICALYRRYSSDSELQRSLVLDGEVHGEFSRQRSHLERLANAKKTPLKPMKLSGPISRDKEKLLKENLFLLDELNRVRAENDDMKAKYKLMESTMSVSHKFASANVLKAKLEQARCNMDEINRKHKAECDELKAIIDVLRQSGGLQIRSK